MQLWSKFFIDRASSKHDRYRALGKEEGKDVEEDACERYTKDYF